MLRCPKCSRVYQDGSQRFCIGDGGRLLGAGQAPEQTSNGRHSRRTPPGELMGEIFIAPPDEEPSSAAIVPASRPSAPLFQPFGLHSSNSADARRDETTNGFRSFNSLIVDNGKTTFARGKNLSNLTKDSRKLVTDDDVRGEKRKSETPSVIFYLLGALLFLTGLAFASTYFFRQ